MPIWFRRFRMSFDLRHQALPPAVLPAGCELLPWHDDLLDAHVWVKFRSFSDTADTAVFPSLGSEEGCYRLMRDITGRPGFFPGTCWLAVSRPEPDAAWQPCGTIQGLQVEPETGAIQNVGVIRPFRGSGLGSCLVTAALRGFREQGMRNVTLEVTARNPGAVRLYARLGFVVQQVVYKPGNVAARD